MTRNCVILLVAALAVLLGLHTAGAEADGLGFSGHLTTMTSAAGTVTVTAPVTSTITTTVATKTVTATKTETCKAKKTTTVIKTETKTKAKTCKVTATVTQTITKTKTHYRGGHGSAKPWKMHHAKHAKGPE